MRPNPDHLLRRIVLVACGLALGGLMVAGLAVPSGAQEPEQYPISSTTTVTAPPTSVLGATTLSGSGTLPVTGSDIVGMAAIGAVALVAGVGLVIYRRHVDDRRATSSASPAS